MNGKNFLPDHVRRTIFFPPAILSVQLIQCERTSYPGRHLPSIPQLCPRPRVRSGDFFLRVKKERFFRKLRRTQYFRQRLSRFSARWMVRQIVDLLTPNSRASVGMFFRSM